MSTSSSTTSTKQADLFPEERRLGPVLEVLDQELDPAGFASLKRFAQRLEFLIEGQKEKTRIREQYYELRARLGAKEAQQQIMTTYNLEYDLFDKIIYPRIGN